MAGSAGTCQKSCPEKNCFGSVTWNLLSRSRCTLNWSSGYLKWASSSVGMSARGLMSLPPNALFHAFSTGSLSSNEYSVTFPSYASTVAFTELRR